MKRERDFPERLLTGADPASGLIRRALAEPPAGLREDESFHRLEARLEARSRRWLLPAVAVAALSAVVVWRSTNRPALERVSVVAEKLTPQTGEPPPASARVAVVSGAAPVASASARPRSAASAKIAARDDGDPAECGQLARAADYEGAAACYARLGRGSRMSAELSLYEKARIEAKALGQPERALATLSEHARRFPAGALASEVGLTRIELLSQLGRRAEALSAIEHALGTALGRERGADLQALRADLSASEGQCERAREALALARAAGAHSSRLDGVERRCPSSPEAHE